MESGGEDRAGHADREGTGGEPEAGGDGCGHRRHGSVPGGGGGGGGSGSNRMPRLEREHRMGKPGGSARPAIRVIAAPVSAAVRTRPVSPGITRVAMTAGNTVSSPSALGLAMRDPAAAPARAPAGQQAKMASPETCNAALRAPGVVSARAKATVSSLSRWLAPVPRHLPYGMNAHDVITPGRRFSSTPA